MIYRAYNILINTKSDNLLFEQYPNDVSLENNSIQYTQINLIYSEKLSEEIPRKEKYISTACILAKDGIVIHWGNRIVYKIDGNNVFFFKSPFAYDVEISLSLNYILSVMSLQNNMIPLHACCVQSPSGLTCAFSGKSCSGKSTLTAQLLSKGWKFVSEELIICNIGDDKKINTYTGPQFIRLGEKSLHLVFDKFDITSIKVGELDKKELLWSESWHVATNPIHLDKIIFIEDGFATNTLEQMSFSESIHKIFNNIYSTMFCNSMPKNDTLNTISEICKKADCQRYLYRDYPDVDFLENKIGKIGF